MHEMPLPKPFRANANPSSRKHRRRRTSTLFAFSAGASDPTRSHLARGRGAAFTLVEVLLVVVILGILAGMVVPQFASSSDDARDSVLMQNLSVFRHQIELFKAHHGGNPPGFGGNVPLIHLLFYTDADGNYSFTESASYPYGPYFTSNTLANPYSGSYVKDSTDPHAETPNNGLKVGSEVVGWFYDKSTGVVAANAEGSTASGTPRISL